MVPLSKEVEKKMEESFKRSIKKRIENQKKQLKRNLTLCEEQPFAQVSQLINDAKRITVLTGAGISTMSGIPDYRSAVEGVWRKKPDLLETLNQETFLEDPDQFWESYYQLFAVTLSEIIPVQTSEAVMTAIDLIQPNEGHRFFAKLEEKGKEVAILTQNVDGLHQKAGSKQVLEIHGNVTTCSCPLCGRRYELKNVYNEGTAPTCECGCVLRPDVVFFGDPVKEYERAEEIIAASDLIVVAGTSL
jgi:NAD-dependent SIR2 family protein deacetylase